MSFTMKGSKYKEPIDPQTIPPPCVKRCISPATSGARGSEARRSCAAVPGAMATRLEQVLGTQAGLAQHGLPAENFGSKWVPNMFEFYCLPTDVLPKQPNFRPKPGISGGLSKPRAPSNSGQVTRPNIFDFGKALRLGGPLAKNECGSQKFG